MIVENAGRMSEAERCANTERPLTHPLATTRRGLAMKATPNWRTAVYAPLTGEGKRRMPRKDVAARLYEQAEGRCTYCTLPVTATALRRGRTVKLRREWDHFVPFSYLGRNPNGNWRLACHVCNNLKGDMRFDTVEQAVEVVRRMREQAGYEPISDAWARLLAEPYSPWIPPQVEP